jgi:hypothetical protein
MGLGVIRRREAPPWLRIAGGVVYPLPWLVVVQEAGESWGLAQVGGTTVFALYLAIGVGELAVSWGLAQGRRARGVLGWHEESRRRKVPGTVTRLVGRHRQDLQLPRVGRHRAPGRHALRSAGSVPGGRRVA